METCFSERVSCAATITAPSELSALEVKEQLSTAKWTFEIDLMFEVTGKVLNIEMPTLLQKKEANAAWEVTFLFEIKLESYEPIPEGYYDSEGTIEYFNATLDLPNSFYQILQGPFRLVE
jgi:hypothetical protein